MHLSHAIIPYLRTQGPKCIIKSASLCIKVEQLYIKLYKQGIFLNMASESL